MEWTEIEKQNLIISKLVEDGWQVTQVSYGGRSPITAKKKFAEIVITTEECWCHGGRLWITDAHTHNFYEISHPTYDEDLGITDSSSELKYIIENEMMDYVNRYSSVVYKLVKINEYGKQVNGADKEEVIYYGNMETLARRIAETNISDIFAIEKEKYQCPNENVYYITERIYKEGKYSWEKERIWFKKTEFNRANKQEEFKEVRSFEMYVEIFNKQR
jgi:hypothetical protein